MILSGMTMVVRSKQLWNAKEPIVRTVFGIVTVLRPLHGRHETRPVGLLPLASTIPYPRQCGKAQLPILGRLLGRIIDVRLVHSRNDPCPILRTDAGNDTVTRLKHA